MLNIKKFFSPKHVFFVFCSAFFLTSVVSMIVTRGSYLFDLDFGNDGYMDFFNHIVYVENPSEVYYSSRHACFPPLVYLMYLLFNRILPEGSITMYNSDVSPYAMLLYIIYFAAASLLLYGAVNTFLKFSSKTEKILSYCAIFFSNIFIFGVAERGNSALLVIILLIYAMAFRDSESKTKRELALIFIALAAGIKIYPAVFGLIYLKEKRWREAIRLIGYGLIAFLLPFVFFGGFDSVIQFFKLQSDIHTYPSSTIYSINALFNFLTDAPANSSGATIAALITAVIFVAVFFLLPLKKWQQYFMLSAIIVLVPAWSGYYTMIYLALPLVAFLDNSSTDYTSDVFDKTFDYIFCLLFSFIFSFKIFFEAFSTKYTRYGRFCEYNVLYAMIIIIIIYGIFALVRSILRNEKSKN